MRDQEFEIAVDDDLNLQLENEWPRHLFDNQPLFFADETRSELLKKLTHLLEYTDLFLFVAGAKGIGKTTLLKHRFIDTPKNNWRVCNVDAKKQTNAQTLFQQIANDLQIRPVQSNDQSSIQQFVEQLDAFRQGDVNVFLAIDNAESLTKEAADIVIQLGYHDQNTKPLAQSIFFGESIPSNLTNAIPDSSGEGLKILYMHGLSEFDTENYIDQVLGSVGYEQTEPFAENTVRAIHDESEGMFPKINQLAQAIWERHLEKLGQLDRSPRRKNSKHIISFKTLAASLGVVAIGFFVYIVVNSDLDKTNSVAQAERVERLLPLPAKEDTSMRSSPNEEPLSPSQRFAQLATQPPSEVSSKEDKLSDIFSMPETTEAKATTAIPDPIQTSTVNTSELKNEDWLNQQPAKRYTLQLLASRKKSAVTDFIKQHNIEQDAAYFPSIRNGDQWYAVVYGNFENRQSAKAAAKNLPPSLSTVTPWLRSMRGVQKDIEKQALASQ
ncbi:MAG: SPOR domain-containing protein [Gammaproteobacteria bacterium]|nr:SPOR domain-containing protein [Gammaproteobacteria bacterium]